MSVEFAIAASSPNHFPKDRLPEVCFVGRSNVGKSTLLNTLLQRGRRKGKGPVEKKQLARVSKTPGRTQSINFYRIDGEMYFVDLPGYGFAKVPKQAMELWRQVAEKYLDNRSTLKLVVLIVDIRHGPSALDEQMKHYLEAKRLPFLVVASKADKLKQSQRDAAVRTLEETYPSLVPFSAVTGEGVSALWDGIRQSLDS